MLREPLRIRAAHSNLVTASGALRPPLIATSSPAAIGAMAASPRASIALAVPWRAFGLMQLEAVTAKSCFHLPPVPGGRGPPVWRLAPVQAGRMGRC